MTNAPFKNGGLNNHIVIIGASLAGLSGALALRAKGFRGRLTIVGDEPYLPYDRPPLSKAVLSGKVLASHTTLPQNDLLRDVVWRLGVAAVRLELSAKKVHLADGQHIEFDRLLIATGTRARPWPVDHGLSGVFTLRDRNDALRFHFALSNKPQRVLIVGGGFTGSEVASACRELGLDVTLVERGKAPLSGALGGFISKRASLLQQAHGVDLRCGLTVTALEGDAHQSFCRAQLSDNSVVEADVALIALGSIRNVDWLKDSGLAVGPFGVGCDAGCRVFGDNLIVTDDIFVAGDVARFPHPAFGNQFLSLEHWGNAVEQAQIAAHNMICLPEHRIPHLPIPAFWSSQFRINIKSVGVPSAADQVMITQGSLESGSFVAAYGNEGRLCAAVSFNQGRWLEYYERLIAECEPFPLRAALMEGTPQLEAVSAEFPDHSFIVREATAILTGYDPSHRRVQWVPRNIAERRK